MTRSRRVRLLPAARRELLAWFVLIVFGAALGGCHEGLIPTPYVMYGESGRRVFERTPDVWRTPDAPILYVTDRLPEKPGPRGARYGYKRNRGMEYGVAICSFGADVTWDELVADSTGPERARAYRPAVSRVEKCGEFAPIMSRAKIVDGRLATTPEGVEAIEAEQDAFDRTVAQWLDHAERREVVVFVHGFNNTFDEAVMRLAQAWHFTGREGVPIVFTWPAGSPGLLAGYQHDRESGEFANLHLKQLLVTLARNPKVERVHIISHSRGTDVATTALRELNAEARAALGQGIVGRMIGATPPDAKVDPRLPYQALKIDTLVLAAPDLDLDVFSQRFVGDNVLNAAGRTVIYFSVDDAALGWARWLFGSRRRVGNIQVGDLTPEARAELPKLTSLQLINCTVSGGSTHSYVMQHPAALSDLILLLRDRREPGVENGRPLGAPTNGFWQLDNSYAKPPFTPRAD